MAIEINRRQLRKYIILAVIAALLGVLSAYISSEEREIRTVAYSYSFTSLFPKPPKPFVRFIAVKYGVSQTTDHGIELAAPRYVMTSLTNAKFPIKPVSEAAYSTVNNHVVEQSSGKDGIIFYTGAIWPVAVDTVKIEVGWYEGPLSASGNILTLKRIHGRWVVIKNQLCWIS